MDQVRVVLDCDTANEVDDQFAIAHTLGLPEETLEVRGVISVHNTTAHGPGSRDMYQEEAERVVSDLDERRILAGLMEALARHPESWSASRHAASHLVSSCLPKC
jgi:hypothetical protein